MDKFWIIRDGMVSGSLTAKKWPNQPENIVKATDDVNRIGHRWNGTEFTEAPATDIAAEYSGIEFYEAIGDPVAIEMMLSEDVGVRLIERKFNATIAAGGRIRMDHPETKKAFQYLLAEGSVPSFDADVVKRLNAKPKSK